MDVEIRSVDFGALRCRTRIPFRFGRVTMTEAPLLTARVVLRADGTESLGHAADLAVPQWFDKDPAATPADDLRALVASVRRAGQAFEGEAGTAFAIWQRAYARCTAGELATGKGLVDGFGVALVERAMLDALCRAAGLSFRDLIAGGHSGFAAGALLPAAADIAHSRICVDRCPDSVRARHTVGGLDPLHAHEVPGALRGDDGHPVSLEEDIRRYGLSAFKLKIVGDVDADFARLTAIARVVAEHAPAPALFTLDANEQYPDLARPGELLDRLSADADGRAILEGLAYVEQPLPRALTLDPATRDAVRAVSAHAPLIIDEADDAVDAFERALAIGYRGVSVKNCKGVFRALANRALVLARAGEGAFQTSEDLTNLPVLALQQDLTTLAALGLTHTERNGHHYFPGLDVLPAAEADAALAAQPDLYERRDGRVVLRIEAGRISLACTSAVGFGVASAIDWDARIPLGEFDVEGQA